MFLYIVCYIRLYITSNLYFPIKEQRARPSVHPPAKMEIPTLSHLSEFSFRPVFQKSSNRIFSKNKSRYFVSFLKKVQLHRLSYLTLSVIFSFSLHLLWALMSKTKGTNFLRLMPFGLLTILFSQNWNLPVLLNHHYNNES